MAIQETQIKEMSGGFSKGLDAGAMDMIFDNLQISQYINPIKSVIREVVSNGLDSIREKNIAKSILSGAAKVEDYYVERDGPLYKDSRFDASYYDPSFLSMRDDVVITYSDGGSLGKDTITIQDFGVGLGGKRLKGYFNLGFSSKRLNKFALGKFGLGAKSPLATREPFYTMVTRWNGMEFAFNIYGHRLESIVPQLNMTTGQENPLYTWPAEYDDKGNVISEEASAHYLRTREDNSVTVKMMAKKHHKQQYLDAVTSQLLYFNNVRLFVEEGDKLTEMPVKADILYEDDLIVMSSNAPYSKPHIILNGVNYGYIDFRELELEEKLGNIGIKVAPEKVSVNPSRESLIWDDVTRQVVVDKFNEVVGIAEKTINDQLTETDFFKWLKICMETSEARDEARWGGMYSASGNILTRLAKIVDLTKIQLRYKPEPKIKADYELFEGIEIHNINIRMSREGSKTMKIVEYGKNWRGPMKEGKPIFLIDDKFSNRTNKYLLQHVYPQGFLAVKLRYPKGVTPDDISMEHALKRIDRREETFKKNEDKLVAKSKFHIATLTNLIYESSVPVLYSTVVVPEDFKGTDDDSEEVIEVVPEVEKVQRANSIKERRRLEGKVLIQTPQYYKRESGVAKPDSGMWAFSKVEIEALAIDSLSVPEIYWGNNDAQDLIETAARIGFNTSLSKEVSGDNLIKNGLHSVYKQQAHASHWLTENPEIMLFKVAQNNEKYFRDFPHISRFYKTIKGKTITMSNVLIRWNTARKIGEKIEQLKFLKNFEGISPELHQKYENLLKYHYKNDIHLSHMADSAQEQITAHLDNVAHLQLFVRKNPDDTEAIATLAKHLFNPGPGIEINDGAALDLPFYDLYLQLLDWSEPVRVMMNMVKPTGVAFNENEEAEIRSYFKYRNCPL